MDGLGGSATTVTERKAIFDQHINSHHFCPGKHLVDVISLLIRYIEVSETRLMLSASRSPLKSATCILLNFTLLNLAHTDLEHGALREHLPVMDEVRLFQRDVHLRLASLQNFIIVCLDCLSKRRRALGH